MRATYSRFLLGCLFSMGLAFEGCGRGNHELELTRTAASMGAAVDVYVTQAPLSGPNAILKFSTSAIGSVPPVGSLSLSGELLEVLSVSVDPYGQIYVGGNTGTQPEILVFASGSSGAAVPIRRMTFGGISAQFPGELTFDKDGNLYVGVDNTIVVFPAMSNTPSRIITGGLTQLTEINGIVVDGKGTIYVTNGTIGLGSVLAFSANANGNASPIQVYTSVGGAPLYDPSGITLDSKGNLFVAGYTSSTGPSSIFELSPGVGGNLVLTNSITGSATGLAGIGSLQVDGADNLYTTNIVLLASGSTATYALSVSMFRSGTMGNAPPIRTFSSSAWTSPGYAQAGLD